MTDKKDEPGANPAKRPFATLDLRAVEVPSASGQGAPVAPKAATPPSQAEAAQKVAAAAAAASPRPAATSQSGIPVTGSAPTGAKAAASARASDSTGKDHSGAPAAAAATAGPAASAARGSGFGRVISHTLAGVVGGALAIAGAPFITPQLTPILAGLGVPMPPPPALAPEVSARIAALERSAATKPQIDPAADPARALAATEANRRRLDELTASLATVRDAQTRAQEVATGLEARLAKEPSLPDAADRVIRLEQQLAAVAAIAKADPSAGRIPQLAQLTGRLADVESTMTSRMTALRKEVLQDVEARVTPSTEASETARTGTQRLDRDVIALKSETNRIASGLDQVKTSTDRLQLAMKASQDETATIGTRLDGFRRDVESRLTATAKPADVSTAVAPLASKVTALEQSLGGVVRSETERKATAERIVLSLELGNLKRAMERGQPYTQELAEVQKVSGNRIDLAPLEPHRSKGVPTLPELSRSFRAVANAILDAERDKTDGGVVDRLMSGAKTFVRVRKTTHNASDTTAEAIVARMETALAGGRLGDVLSEAKALAAKPPAATEWLAKVEARQTVEAALAAMDVALKSSLGAGPAELPAAQKKAAP